jgi:hypothetical protein
VMREAVEERAGEPLGTEHGRPLIERQIARDQRVASLVALAEDLEQGSSAPDGQTGKRTVRLSNNHELNAAALKPSRDDHGLTVARMEPVSDPAFNRLFAGSMSCVRAEAGRL